MYDVKKDTWLNPNIEYIFDVDIYEMDIEDAGFSIIRQFNLLPDDKIKELGSIEKGIKRHIAIGKLQRDDKQFSKELANKFAEVRRVFLDVNQINDNSIISVKRDAIYTIGLPERTVFGLIRYRPKNHYTSYIRFPMISNLELYYEESALDIKGMNDSALNRHRIYMYAFLRECIGLLESRDSSLKRKLSQFIQDYKWNNLEPQFYLEFNNASKDLNPVFNYKNILVPLVQLTLREIC